MVNTLSHILVVARIVVVQEAHDIYYLVEGSCSSL